MSIRGMVLITIAVCIGLVHGQSASSLAGSFPSTTFEQTCAASWGQPNSQGSVIQLKLDQASGSGIESIHTYFYGFFSALIKLPASYSAGVVTAFYISNYDTFPHNHDEVDFEFLGVAAGTPYLLQTNIYGDGSAKGREERINLWFDATADFHRYSILWNSYQLVFFIDDIPIRRMARSGELGHQYPSKPMKAYSSIWDGSNWATDGGHSPVNYAYGPFVASFTDLKLQGCEEGSICSDQQNEISSIRDLTEQQKNDLAWVRENHLTYTYCNDRQRYPIPFPECS
ncbi:probable xyloglucan endotransglucosylase/hydrolase protein 28 [Selaginella moellendorffii]|nr:probable xyloglucan endotransglucosylase/hydrolase protein 28 [Selaginella moellendorffii]|eukprot:XP_002981828.2 probable xyloglucan endotransglucosylase/hydrolase protein 28 [Selaginella moellendorffii]